MASHAQTPDAKPDQVPGPPARDERGYWLKGHSGNRKGRPSLTEELRRAVDKDRLIQALYLRALDDDHKDCQKALQYLWDRLDGPIRQEIAAEVSQAPRRVLVLPGKAPLPTPKALPEPESNGNGSEPPE